MVSSKPSGHLLKKKKARSINSGDKGRGWGEGWRGHEAQNGAFSKMLKMEHLVRCSEIEIELKSYGFG